VDVDEIGRVTLPVYTGQAHIGHRYTAKYRSIRIDAGAADGTAQGKIGRVSKAVVRLDQTGYGLKIGADFDLMDPLDWRDPDRNMRQADPLKDGDTIKVSIPGGYQTDKTVALKHDEPLPCSIVAIFPELTTQDG